MESPRAPEHVQTHGEFLMSQAAWQPHIWSREEYDRMIAAGVFRSGARLELVDGEILEMTPQGSLHATSVRLVEDALRRVFGQGYDVRSQFPLAMDNLSEPEPDIAVVTGGPRDYRDAHPGTALLVVEVSDSSLGFDRTRKLALYARNRIAEYWIVNLPENRLERYRQPENEVYSQTDILGPEDILAEVAGRNCRIPIADLLP
jgi:Uma2 family endonuclease